MATYIYTAPVTSYDISFGQTFKQRMMEKREDGTFATYFRRIVIGAQGNQTNTLPEWTAATINLTAEQARETAKSWNDKGLYRETTRNFGLENIDAEEKAKAERIAARKLARGI